MTPLSIRLRTLRLRQNRRLEDIASQCGFTKSLLSKIESGKTSPPLATLAKIATALGIKLTELLQADESETTVLTRAQKPGGQPATITDKGYAFQLLAASRADKAMQPFLMTAEKGKIKTGALSHRGEEFVYVLSGRMRYRVGGTTYTMEPGDSLYFNAEEEHDLEPLSDTVRYLAIFNDTPATPPPHAKPRNKKRK